MTNGEWMLLLDVVLAIVLLVGPVKIAREELADRRRRRAAREAQ